MPHCSRTSRPDIRLESEEEKDTERGEGELVVVWRGEEWSGRMALDRWKLIIHPQIFPFFCGVV